MKKTILLLLALCLLAGCGQGANASSSAPASSSSAESSEAPSDDTRTNKTDHPRGQEKLREEDSKSLIGRVTSVDGSAITLETMGWGDARAKDGGPEGSAPRAPSEGQEPPEEESPPESGVSRESRPDKGKRGGQKPPRMEQLTVTLPDGCEILVQKDGESAGGTLSDVVVDSILRIAYADDGETVQSVSVNDGMPGGFDGPGRQAACESEEASAAD